jgi:hypothetical protein
MKKLLLVLGALMMLALPAFAQVKESHGTKNGKPYFSASQKTTGSATVLDVNKTTREVTLQMEAGDTATVKAGPAVNARDHGRGPGRAGHDAGDLDLAGQAG